MDLLSTILLMTHIAMPLGYKMTTIIETHSVNDYHYTFPNGTSLHYSSHNYFDYYLMLVISYFSVSIFTILFMSHIVNKTNSYMSDSDSDSDSDNEDEGYEDDNEHDNEDEDACYEQQHFDSLEALTDRALSSEELNQLLSNRFLTEETPKGTVVMSYNVDAESFEYYTDKYSELTYETLDTVARLFTCTFDCKQICVNYRAEVENGKTKMLSEIEYDKIKKELLEQNIKEREQKSVFASFKSYNKKSGNNVEKKYYVITEKANRFKYKGKLSDYQNMIDKPKADERASSNTLSYAEYKRILTEQAKCNESKCNESKCNESK